MNSNREASGSVKRCSNVYWLSFFFILAVSIFFFRGFLFNEYGGVKYYLIEDIIPFLVLMLFLFVISFSPIFFHMISLENKQWKKKGDFCGLFSASVAGGSAGILYFFVPFSIFVVIFSLWMFKEVENSLLLYFSALFIIFVIAFGSLIILFKSVKKNIDIFHSYIANISDINKCRGGVDLFIESVSFRSLLYFDSFVLFIGAFLSDLLRRSVNEAMVGVYIFFYMLFLTIPISIFIFIGMLIVTKGIKKSFISKLSFLLFTTITSILIFYVFFRMFLIDVYI